MNGKQQDDLFYAILESLENAYAPSDFGLPPEIDGNHQTPSHWWELCAEYATQQANLKGVDGAVDENTVSGFADFMNGKVRMSLLVPAYVPVLLRELASSPRAMGEKITELIVSACLPPKHAPAQGILERIEALLIAQQK
jgi:hypothetical protein